MSVRIHDGLRSIAKDDNGHIITDPFLIGVKIREVLEPLFFEKFENALEDKMKMREFCDLVEVSFEQNVLHRKFKGEKYDFVDLYEANIGYEVTLFPSRLLLISSGVREYTNALIEQGIIEEYGYWTDADEDDEIDEESWAQREKDWSVIFDNDSFNIGLKFRFPDKIDTMVKIIQRSHDEKDEPV